MKTHILLLFILLTLPPFYVQGNELTDSVARNYPENVQARKVIEQTKYVYFNDGKQHTPAERDSMASLMTIFYANQFRNFQDPHAPYLMFMSDKANFAMGIAGVIRMRAWYDWNGSIPANGFCPYLIPIPGNPAQMKRLSATPAGTALVFTMFGRSRWGDYMGYIEAGFNGYDNVGMKLKKAYFMIGGLTVGYAESTFTDPSSVPPVIDGAGPNGKSVKTNVLVRYMHTFKNRWVVAGGVEIPKSQISTNDPMTQVCPDFVPDIAAFFQYQWNGGASHLRASGLMRVLSYRSLKALENRNVVGWGTQLSAKIKILPQLTFYGQFNYGKGHTSYLNDLSIERFDLIPVYGDDGRLYAPESIGATLGLRYNFLPNLYACLVGGENRFFPAHNPGDDTYKYGLYGAANLFWDITPRIQVGGEYLWGKRKNFNHMSASADRVNVLFQMSF